MVIKLFYNGRKCGNVFVDMFGFDDVFSDGVWRGYSSNGKLICEFSDSEYDVTETSYGWEVNRVV